MDEIMDGFLEKQNLPKLTQNKNPKGLIMIEEIKSV